MGVMEEGWQLSQRKTCMHYMGSALRSFRVRIVTKVFWLIKKTILAIKHIMVVILQVSVLLKLHTNSISTRLHHFLEYINGLSVFQYWILSVVKLKRIPNSAEFVCWQSSCLLCNRDIWHISVDSTLINASI